MYTNALNRLNHLIKYRHEHHILSCCLVGVPCIGQLSCFHQSIRPSVILSNQEQKKHICIGQCSCFHESLCLSVSMPFYPYIYQYVCESLRPSGLAFGHHIRRKNLYTFDSGAVYIDQFVCPSVQTFVKQSACLSFC